MAAQESFKSISGKRQPISVPVPDCFCMLWNIHCPHVFLFFSIHRNASAQTGADKTPQQNISKDDAALLHSQCAQLTTRNCRQQRHSFKCGTRRETRGVLNWKYCLATFTDFTNQNAQDRNLPPVYPHCHAAHSLRMPPPAYPHPQEAPAEVKHAGSHCCTAISDVLIACIGGGTGWVPHCTCDPLAAKGLNTMTQTCQHMRACTWPSTSILHSTISAHCALVLRCKATPHTPTPFGRVSGLGTGAGVFNQTVHKNQGKPFYACRRCAKK